MRLLHTADWQLGLRALQAGERAANVRARRFDAARRAVTLAHQEGVDLVLVAGDTFDSPDVDDRVVDQAVEIFDALAPIPVALLPGNHDPLVAGGVWSRRSWQRVGDHVTLLEEPVAADIIEGATLYPCPLSQKQSRRDPTEWIPARAEGDRSVRIGLAHGALDTLPATGNFPIAVDRAERAGLDYLALGDWHGLSMFERTAYPGTIEQTSYSETDPGFVLLVEVDAGAVPVLEPHRVGELVWTEHAVSIADVTDLEALEATIDALGPPEAVLARVDVSLLVDRADVVTRLETLRRRLEDTLFRLEWNERLEDLAADTLPEGVLHEVDGVLAEALAGVPVEGSGQSTAEKLVDEDPAVLEEARQLLRRLSKLD